MKIAALTAVLLLVVGRIANANVVGADTQNFNPTNDGLDFVTVHSSKTLAPGLINFGFFLNYAVNSLPNYQDTTTQTRTNFSDSLTSADLNVGVGITRNWEAGLSMPVLLSQSVESDVSAFRGEFASNGVTEYRAMTKYHLLGDNEGGVAAVVSANFNQILDNPFVGEDPGPTLNFELVGDKTFGKFAVGVNGGYRARSPGSKLAGVPIEPMGNQIIGSVAVSYLVTEYDTKLISEIFGSVPTEQKEFVSDRDDMSVEFLAGIKTDLTPHLAFHAGGGTEVVHGTSSPDWRIYSGLNWVIGPLFSRPKEVFARVNDQNLRPLEDLENDPFDSEPELSEAFVARDVLFEFNSDQLYPEAEESLQRLVDYALKPPGFKSMTIEGHTDSIGKAQYNLSLSQRRAESVRRKLIEMGLPAAKAKAIGYGESKPIANNGNFQGRAMNRRVEFRIER